MRGNGNTPWGVRAIAGEERMVGTLVRVILSDKQGPDAVMLEMGRMLAESVMLMEREEVAGLSMIRSTRGSRSGRMRRAPSISATRRSK